VSCEFQFDTFLSKFLAAHPNKEDNFKNVGVNGRVILKLSLKGIGLEYVD
jgi:hypothetical protein